ncbi:Zn2Cys6 [Trichoderma simmonsii]|uniref:Zn2Cys6 n=1 Tax=Trichoderma simmonsii TaxID=1491479 RepID=A0A8G0LR00_9HYPO|nr:Zn2Cys6 [Trichoderma simmonsii]
MDDRPARRMRLGTKSCAECRRRKVRCVFPTNSSVCHGCELHQTPCRAQQPRPRDRETSLQTIPQAQSHAQLAEDNAALRRRVVELEGLVGSICDALEPTGDSPASGAASTSAASTSTDVNNRAIQVIKNLRNHGLLQAEVSPNGQPYNFGTALTNPGTLLPSGPPSSSFFSPGSVDQDLGSSPPDLIDKSVSAVDAPLISLFRDALLIRDGDGELYDDPEDPSMVYLMKESLSSFRPPIPDPGTLRLILEESHKFWAIWPPFFFAPDQSATMQNTSIDDAEAYFNQVLNFGRGVEFCSAMLFLTLCIQQLPRNWKHIIVSPSISRQVLIDAYIRFVAVLLAVEGEESVLVVQCYVMLHKVLVNMGRPQRAWVAIRQAISAATLVGLDRLEPSANFQRKTLWANTWMVERQLCIMLGFPSAVTDRGTKEDPTEVLDNNMLIHRRLCIIMGRIVERNQNPAKASYAATVQLDQDMEELKNSLPPDGAELLSPGATTDSVYSEEGAKIFFYSTLKHIHLPYMLKAKTDRRYEHSRLSAMDACRGLLRTYLRMRGSPKTEVVQCEIMDFIIFSSTIALILGILSGSGDSSPAALTGYSEDWQLINRLIGELRKTNALLECTVARQSAEVLETLVAASCGNYNVQEDFVLVVPYFGRLRITQGNNNKPDTSLVNTNSITQTVPSLIDSSELSTVSLSSLPPQKTVPGDPYYMPQQANTIEFSSNEFLNTTFSDFDFQMDLSQDWCTIVDTGVYDWNQMFSTNTMGFR